MKVTGARQLKPSELSWLQQYAEKVPEPFEVFYDSDIFIFSIKISLQSIQAISQDALTESSIDIIPLSIRKQLQGMKMEVDKLLRDLCGVYELPTTLVMRDQYGKYMGQKN